MIRTPKLLAEYIRDGLVEAEHFGYIIAANNEKIIDREGESANYPFYLRSCAKPLQASLIIDYGMDKEFDMTEKEIALCCASHAGEKIHTELADGLLKKFGLEENLLKCGLHSPLSKTAQEELLLSKTPVRFVHNNCSGKHIFMLGLCKMNGWDLKTYDDLNHPLQQEIKKKIYELCGIAHSGGADKDYPVTKDGCGVPIFSMPLFNMAKGYINLFCDPKYEKIKNAFLNHPYVIGGENRTDTKIIQHSKNIIAKVGAGGLCIVVNLESKECLVVKISDCDMKVRELVVLNSLKNLRWANIEADIYIKTLHGDRVGEIVIS